MLVLARKKNEKIMLDALGMRIELTVVEIRGDKVRIGIDAAASVAIWRSELGEFKRDAKTAG